jgi:hypothetical protein
VRRRSGRIFELRLTIFEFGLERLVFVDGVNEIFSEQGVVLF